jgi:arylsulfatase A-like enzyme
MERVMGNFRRIWLLTILGLLGFGLLTFTLTLNSFKPRFLGFERTYPVIILTVDSLRADHLPCYGYERNTSPHICALAEDGVLFRQAIAQGAETKVSYPSILTSTFPPTHGIREFNQTIPPNLPTFLEVLKERGWQVKVWGPEEVFPILLHGRDIDVEAAVGEWVKIDEILTHLTHAQSQSEPFLILSHSMTVHFPYDSVRWRGLYLQNTSVNESRWYELIFDIIHRGKPRNITLPDEVRKVLIARYDEGIREEDDNVGKILKKLKELKLYERSLIIFTSDHGEGWGGKIEEINHGTSLAEGIIHVPLIIKFPHNEYAGVVVDQLVRLVDLAPTIMDVLNIEDAMRTWGVSLVPAIEGEKLHLVAYSETPGGRRALRTERYKYVFHPTGAEELYELTGRGEILIDRPELTQRFRAEMGKFLLLETAIPEEVELTEQIKERLRELGYVVN